MTRWHWAKTKRLTGCGARRLLHEALSLDRLLGMADKGMDSLCPECVSAVRAKTEAKEDRR